MFIKSESTYNLQLEQMELEVRGMNGTARDRLRGRVESHRAELKRLTQEFQTAKKPKEDVMEITMEESWDNNVTEEQRKRLLDASERIERSGRTLQNGYRMALETEEISTEVLKDLHEQRETIQRSRGRVNYTFEAINNHTKKRIIIYNVVFASVTRNRCGARTWISVIIGNDLPKPPTENHFSSGGISTHNCRVLCDILQL